MIDENEEFTSLTEAGNYAHTTRQAIFVAIKKGELKATKRRVFNKRNRWLDQWVIQRGDLDEYRMSKYNREKRKVDGEKLFDIERDRWSVLHAAKAISTMLGISYPAYRLYYQLRIGKVRGFKKAGAWIIKKDEFLRIYHDELAKLPQKEHA